LNGAACLYDQDGNLLKQSHYRDHQLDGEDCEYYQNGAVREVTHYRRDVLHGEVLKYDEHGELTARLFYREGQPANPPTPDDATSHDSPSAAPEPIISPLSLWQKWLKMLIRR
jgi:hypothetical protein